VDLTFQYEILPESFQLKNWPFLFCFHVSFSYCLTVCNYFFSYTSFRFIFTYYPSPFLFSFPSLMHFILPFFHSSSHNAIVLSLGFSFRHLKCLDLFSSLRLNVFLSSFTYFYFLLCLFVSPCLLISYFILFFLVYLLLFYITLYFSFVPFCFLFCCSVCN
jgi:hypothetical protein